MLIEAKICIREKLYSNSTATHPSPDFRHKMLTVYIQFIYKMPNENFYANQPIYILKLN